MSSENTNEPLMYIVQPTVENQKNFSQPKLFYQANAGGKVASENVMSTKYLYKVKRDDVMYFTHDTKVSEESVEEPETVEEEAAEEVEIVHPVHNLIIPLPDQRDDGEVAIQFYAEEGDNVALVEDVTFFAQQMIGTLQDALADTLKMISEMDDQERGQLFQSAISIVGIAEGEGERLEEALQNVLEEKEAEELQAAIMKQLLVGENNDVPLFFDEELKNESDQNKEVNDIIVENDTPLSVDDSLHDTTQQFVDELKEEEEEVNDVVEEFVSELENQNLGED